MVSVYCLTTSNQKEAISGTVSGRGLWLARIWILLRIPAARILWDFNFLRGLAPDLFEMDFRSEDTRRSVKFSTFLLWGLKAERCHFPGKKCSGAGALSKQGFLPCFSIIRNSQQRTQTPSKSLKKTLLRQKDDYIPQVRYHDLYT